VDAGKAAAEAIGKVVSAHVIPRPHDEIPDLLERPPVR
jgi:ethanolamine utilization protein EutM